MGQIFQKRKIERLHLLVLGVDLKGYNQIVRINNIAIERKQYILSRTGKFFCLHHTKHNRRGYWR